MKYRQNERGFAFLFEIILAVGILAIVALAIFTGMHQAKPTTKASPAVAVGATPTPDPVLKWTTYIVADGNYKFRYKPGWYVASGGDYSPGAAYLDTKPIPAGEGAFRMSIQSHAGDHTADAASGLTGISLADRVDRTETVDVDGVTGTRVELTATRESEMQPPVKGEKDIVYNFYANGMTYSAYYSQQPGQPDLSKDFDEMIKKSLQFGL
jgi:hypothetical protein